MNKTVKGLYQFLKSMIENPRLFARLTNALPRSHAALEFSSKYRSNATFNLEEHVCASPNPLGNDFQGHRQGRGTCEIGILLRRLSSPLRTTCWAQVDVSEIGVYSGGA
jgi:hypothetical protein